MEQTANQQGTRTIGEYELCRRIGKGGMAEVWMGRRAGFGGAAKPCAIKLMLPHIADDPRHRRMFLAEAKLCMQLTNANIVQVFDVGEHEQGLYIVMEWVDGTDLATLATLMRRTELPMPDAVTAYIVGELLHALNYAHRFTSHGRPLELVHRDVSPQNVMISAAGEVKLTDFGVARIVRDESSQEYAKGKLRYMAREHLTGNASPRSDLFAVGAILHELVSGEKFREGLDEGMMYGAIFGDVVPPTPRADLPIELEALRVALLQPDPLRRLGSADEALLLLERWSGYRNQRMHLQRIYRSFFGGDAPRSGLTGYVGTPRDEGLSKRERDCTTDTWDARDASPSIPVGPGATVLQEGSVRMPMSGPTALLGEGMAYGEPGGTIVLPDGGLGSSTGLSRERSYVLAPSSHGHGGAGVPMFDRSSALHRADVTASMLAAEDTSVAMRDDDGEPGPRHRWVWAVVASAWLAVIAGGLTAWWMLEDEADSPPSVATTLGASEKGGPSPERANVAPVERTEPTIPSGAPTEGGVEVPGEGGVEVPGEGGVEVPGEAPSEVPNEPPGGAPSGAPGEAGKGAEPGATGVDSPTPRVTVASTAPRSSARRKESGPRARSRSSHEKLPSHPPEVSVTFVLSGLRLAYVRVDKGSPMVLEPRRTLALPAGAHTLRWSPDGRTWTSAGSREFESGYRYLVRITPEGPAVERTRA